MPCRFSTQVYLTWCSTTNDLFIFLQSKDPRFHALPLTSQRVAAFSDTVNELVYDVLISKVRQRLSEVARLPIWSSVEEQGGLPLPSFSAYPQAYVTSVGEYLLTLPQQLEPLAEGISGNEAGNDEAQFFATEWIFKVIYGKSFYLCTCETQKSTILQCISGHYKGRVNYLWLYWSQLNRSLLHVFPHFIVIHNTISVLVFERSSFDSHICFYVSGCWGCHCFVHGAAAWNPLHHRSRRASARCGHWVPEQRPLCALDADPSVPVHLPLLRLDPEGPGPWSHKIRRRKPARPPYYPFGVQDPADLTRLVKRNCRSLPHSASFISLLSFCFWPSVVTMSFDLYTM